MSTSFSDDVLKKAVINADQYEINHWPSDDEITHEFSDEFLQKMKRLIRQSKTSGLAGRGSYHRRRVVAIIAAIILLMMCAMSISSVRAAIIDFINQVYEEFTYIFFSRSPSAQDMNEELTIYEPTYIPEGFTLFNKNIKGLVLIEYKKDRDMILYSQQYVENISININTEDVQVQNMEMNELPAVFFSNQGFQNVIWYDDKYMYTVSSTLDKETVLEIAKSVEKTGINSSP